MKKIGIILIIAGGIAAASVVASILMKPYGKLPDKDNQKGYSILTGAFSDGQFHNESEVLSSGETVSGKKELPDKKLSAENPELSQRADDGELKVTWLGHSSVFLQMGSQNVLIDPVLSAKKSIMPFMMMPDRFSEIPAVPEDFPEIDVLCISHDHYDHLNYKTIMALDDKVKNYVVPLGVDVILEGWGIDESKISAHCWWDSADIDGVTYTLTPAQHSSGRSSKQNRTLWGGIYMQDSAHSVYFTGDTGYYDVFSRIYEQFGETDLMLADCGQDSPAWAHMTPAEGVRAAQDAHAKWLIPVHWGAYMYGSYKWSDPGELTLDEAEKAGISAAVPRIGKTFGYDDIADQNERWWE